MQGPRLFAVALLFSFLGLPRADAHAGDGMQMLRFLPESTALVASWNTARSRLSPAGTALIDAVAGNRRLGAVQALRARAGIDWKRDVDTVVLGLAGNFARSERFVLVVDGRFDRGKLVAAARRGKGFASRQHHGITYFQSGKLEIAFLDGLWVTTRRGRMPRVINVFQGKARSLRRNRTIMGLLRSGDVTKDLWCAFVVPERMRQEIAKEAGGHTVSQGMGSVDFEDFHKQVRARMRLGMSSRAAVIAVATAVRLQGGQNETIEAMGLARPLRTMNVSRKDNNLDITLKPSKAEVKKLARFLRTWDGSSS